MKIFVNSSVFSDSHRFDLYLRNYAHLGNSVTSLLVIDENGNDLSRYALRLYKSIQLFKSAYVPEELAPLVRAIARENGDYLHGGNYAAAGDVVRDAFGSETKFTIPHICLFL